MRPLTSHIKDKTVYAEYGIDKQLPVIWIVKPDDDGQPGIWMTIAGAYRYHTSLLILHVLKAIGFDVIPAPDETDKFVGEQWEQMHQDSLRLHTRFTHGVTNMEKKGVEGTEEANQLFEDMKTLASVQGAEMNLNYLSAIL